MKNKIDLVNDCFSMLLRTGVTVNASPSDNVLALNRLEDMMAELESRNLATGYNFEDSPEPDSPSGLENWMNLAISQMLAMRVWPDFSPDEVNPMLARNSAQSSANLSARLAQQNALKYARRTPLGSGNQPYQQYNKFFGDYGSTCGPSDVGSGGCAPVPTPPPLQCSCDVIPLSHMKLLGDEALFGASEKQYSVTGFYDGSTVGGGLFVFNPDGNKSSHNGVTVYAPEALQAWSGTQADIATLLNWTGVGSGVWARSSIPVLTPYHAGAVPNTGMDCTLPTQKVINYLGANGGGKLRLPAGTWDITAQLNLASHGVVVEGDSRFASLIKQKTLNAKTLNITGNFCGVKSLSIIYDGTPVSGAIAIYVTSSYVTLEDFVIRSSHEGVYFDGGNAVAGKVTNFEILDYVAIGLHAKGLNDLFVDNFIINAGSDSRGTLGGIRLENKVEAFICSNGDILMGAYSMTMEAVSNTLGNRPAYNNFTNVFFDSAVNATQINECVETDFVGCWFSGGRFGVGSSGAVVSNSRSVRFTNTRFFNCGGSGVVVGSTSTDVTFMNCKAESNSVTAGDGVAHGFQFADGTQQFKIIGCTASNGLYTGKQGYGIFIGAGCDKFNIVENNLIGNFTGPLLDGTAVSTDKTVMDNRGYNRGGLQSYVPVVEGSSTPGVGTYSVQIGKFQEFGDMVFFTASLTWSAHTGTGGTRITLPHSLSDFGQRVPLSVYYSGLTVGASKEVGAFVGTSGNVLAIRALDPSGGVATEFFDTAGTINISGFYRRA